MDDDTPADLDLTVSVDEMEHIRDRVRRGLVTEFHETNIALRARRKAGDWPTARRLEVHLRRIVAMIRALEVPGE
jgi:hypothetical protein